MKKTFVVEEVRNTKTCQLVAIKIETHNQPLILATAYRPPKSDLKETLNICKELTTLKNKYKSNPFWFGGDMNLPDIDWSTNSIVKFQYLKQINESFLETFNECNLEQIVEFPTRGLNILEIVATNRPNLVNKCEPIAGISDHDTAVLLDVDCHAKKVKQAKRKIYAWNKANITNLKNYVSSAVNNLLSNYAPNKSTLVVY